MHNFFPDVEWSLNLQKSAMKKLHGNGLWDDREREGGTLPLNNHVLFPVIC